MMGAATYEEPSRSGIPPRGEALPAPLWPGEKHILSDGREWEIPELSLFEIHGPASHLYSVLLRDMVNVAEKKLPEVFVTKSMTGAAIELIHIALTRNYPSLDLSKDDVGKLLTLKIAEKVLAALYDMNGFCRELLRRLGIAPVQPTPETEAPGKTGERGNV